MAKTIEIFNGRGQTYRDDKGKYHETEHIYIGANSKADAVRLMKDNGFTMFTLNELNVYFAKGCWGNRMEGITPERGIWYTENSPEEKPKRLV